MGPGVLPGAGVQVSGECAITLEVLQGMVGRHCITRSDIYIYSRACRTPAGQRALVVGVRPATGEGASMAEAKSCSVTAEATTPGEARSIAELGATAHLLFPDGQSHWTWVVMGQVGHNDSLELCDGG